MNQSQKPQSRADDLAAPTGRKNPDKGLPDEAALLDLARTYLDLQRRLWPELVRAKVLPSGTAKSSAELADQFRDLFLGDDQPPEYPSQSKLWKQLGAVYLRYSCDNSNPRSLDQQLKKVLERAANDGVFVPWAYVFADAAVSGTTAARRGYQLAKATVSPGPAGPHCVYVDEIGRASRDAMEALRLGKLIEKCRKRMVGVSDGFDSEVPHWKMTLQMFAMVQEWFVDQLRSKVLRGMADGFFQGKNLGRAPLGYKLITRTDTAGRPLLNEEGHPEKTKAIDEIGAAHVREAFYLFAVERLSREKIGQRFNEKEVGGQCSWDATRIKKLLTRETYTGIEFYGMTYQVHDSETGEIEIVHRPREEWKRREVPHLRIVSDDLWAKALLRLKECHEAYQKRRGSGKAGPSRTSAYPSVLVRPTCGHCGSELSIGHSGKYRSFCCLNGTTGKKGCQLRTYKMVSIVEQAVVNHLKAAVFTAEFVSDLVGTANAHLRTEGRQPKESAGPIRAEIKNLKLKQDRLLALCEAGGDVATVAAKIRTHDAKLTELESRLRAAERPTELPTPITAVDVERMVTDLNDLLNEDTVTLAPILRELTGPVTVTQDAPKSKRGATWIAKFAVNMVPVLTRLTRERVYPTSGTWEYLNTRGWNKSHPYEIRVNYIPKHESLAIIVKNMVDGGASLQSIAIAIALGESYATVRSSLIFARSGERPKTKPPGKRTGTRTGEPKFIALASKVAQMRDEEHVPFCRIATVMKTCEATVRRAYDYACRDQVRAAAMSGNPVARGRFVRIDYILRCEIRNRLDRGESAEFVADAVGCSASTVRRISRE